MINDRDFLNQQIQCQSEQCEIYRKPENDSSSQNYLTHYQPYIQRRKQTKNKASIEKNYQSDRKPARNETSREHMSKKMYDENTPKKPETLKTQTTMGHNLWKNRNKKVEEKSFESQKFYKYCTEEIVKISNLNSSLQNSLRQTENKLKEQKMFASSLRSQNQMLKKQLESLKKDLGKRKFQTEKFQQILEEESKSKAKKLKEDFEKEQKQRKRIQQMKQEFIKIIREKQFINSQLLEQIKVLKMQRIRDKSLVEENRRLHQRINETMVKNEKKVKKSEEVEHLWSVKEIQYEKLKKLLEIP